MIGRTGAGKSTLINLILEEKKSLEGGDGFSTTSKNILVYKKNNLALRFYYVKGIECDENTLKNYVKYLKILTVIRILQRIKSTLFFIVNNMEIQPQ